MKNTILCLTAMMFASAAFAAKNSTLAENLYRVKLGRTVQTRSTAKLGVTPTASTTPSPQACDHPCCNHAK